MMTSAGGGVGNVGQPVTAAGDNRASRDEFATIPAALQQARALDSFGDKPLAIISAGSETQDGSLPLQDEMAAPSTRSVHHVLPDEIATSQHNLPATLSTVVGRDNELRETRRLLGSGAY
jgi:hypothetical protein